MNNAASVPTAKKSRLGRFLLYGALLGAAIVVLALAWFAVWRWQLRQSLNAQIAAIRAAGEPVNWTDLAKWPVVIPDSENAALIYLEAIALLPEESGTNKNRFLTGDDIPRRAQPIPEELRDKIKATAEASQAALEVARSVTNAASSRYTVDFQTGAMTPLPFLQDLKRLAITWSCEALLQAEGADAAGASQAVAESLKLSHSLDNEPVLVSQLVAVAIRTLACQSLERVLCRVSLSEDQLKALQEQFTHAETNNWGIIGQIGERALANEYMWLAQNDVRRMVELSNQSAPDEEKEELPYRNPGIGWRLIGFFDRDRNFYLKGMATNLAFLKVGPPTSLSSSNELYQISQRAKKGLYIMSAMFLPALSTLNVKDATLRANLRTAITALALERWRLAHSGALPESLAELVPAYLPAVPADPFDGQPLRYKKLARGYAIYSIGPNQRDDGGREIPPRSVKVPPEERKNYDIVFTVER